MNGFVSALLSLAVIAAAALAAGGAYLLATGRDRKQGLLMFLAAAVLFGNVLVWTV